MTMDLQVPQAVKGHLAHLAHLAHQACSPRPSSCYTTWYLATLGTLEDLDHLDHPATREPMGGQDGQVLQGLGACLAPHTQELRVPEG